MSDEDTQQALEYFDERSDDEKPVLKLFGGKSTGDYSPGKDTELHADVETTQSPSRKWKKLVTFTETTDSPDASCEPNVKASKGTGGKTHEKTSIRKKRAAAREEAMMTNDLMECYTQRAAKSQKKETKPPSGAASSDGRA